MHRPMPPVEISPVSQGKSDQATSSWRQDHHPAALCTFSGIQNPTHPYDNFLLSPVLSPYSLRVRAPSTSRGQLAGNPVPHVSSKSYQVLLTGCGTLGILLGNKQSPGALKQLGILGRERTSVAFHKNFLTLMV